jgi:tripartite-type tricarboxylate transporter receptor subunit TctC
MSGLRGFIAALALAAVGFVHPVAAQTYPEHEIQGTIVWGPGGSTDIVARTITPLAEPLLGTSIILVNRPGGTGLVGMDYVNRRPADGYSVMFGSENAQLYGVLGLSDLDYKQFSPINILARGVVVVVVSADAPWNSFQDLVEDIKKRPGEIKMGTTGVGGVPHVVGAMISSLVEGFDVTSVPMETDAMGLTSIQGGHIDFMPTLLGPASEFIRAGRIKALAVVSNEKIAGLNAPPITEAYPDFNRYLPWGPFYGVFVKKETPDDIKAKLVEAFKSAADDQRFRSVLEGMGTIPMNISGDEAQTFLNNWQSVTAWMLHDTNATKVSPEQLNIPRP